MIEPYSLFIPTRPRPWLNLTTEKPEDGQECWVWVEYNNPVDGAVQLWGWIFPEKHLLVLWLPVELPVRPTAEIIEAALKEKVDCGTER